MLLAIVLKRVHAYPAKEIYVMVTAIINNQRTSGPVNAHLTPGPGIYYDSFIYVYSPGQGQTNPWGQMLMSTESPYHFAHLLQV